MPKKTVPKVYTTRILVVIERTIDKFVKTFKRKPTERELVLLIQKLNIEMTAELERSVGSILGSLFKNQYVSTASALGISAKIGIDQRNRLFKLATDKTLNTAYFNLSKGISNKINVIIQDAYRRSEGLSTFKIKEQIKQVANIADGRASTIARTESAKVAASARRSAYLEADPNDTGLYKHVGPKDKRTTKTSLRIKRRVGRGVRWATYVKIVTEESAKDFPTWTVNPDYPLSHWNTRHIFVKIN